MNRGRNEAAQERSLQRVTFLVVLKWLTEAFSELERSLYGTDF